MGGKQDNAAFVYRKVKGDFSLSCRVNWCSGNMDECGLMLRGSLEGGDAAAVMTLGGRFARMGFRADRGGQMERVMGNTYTWMPAWFKLARVGDVVYAYESTDGVNWFYVHSARIDLPEAVWAGFAGCFNGGEGKNAVAIDRLSLEMSPAAPGWNE